MSSLPMQETTELLPDAAIVGCLVAGDPSGFEELYRRHSPAVFGVARRVTNSAVLAEEVVQEIFLRLWKNPERFDPTRASLRSYLLIDTHARSVELVRSTTARRQREDRSMAGAGPASDDDVEAEAWEIVLSGHLEEALADLPAGEREAIELAYFGGHSYAEVAQILGAPEGTVKSRIRSGLHRLRERLLALDIEVER